MSEWLFKSYRPVNPQDRFPIFGRFPIRRACPFIERAKGASTKEAEGQNVIKVHYSPIRMAFFMGHPRVCANSEAWSSPGIARSPVAESASSGRLVNFEASLAGSADAQ